jgi:hypothetical protein
MATDTPPVSPAAPQAAAPPWSARVLKWLLILMGVLVIGVIAQVVIALNYAYSTGERAGYVQKFSKKGWVCKTWEGEMAVVNLPGAIPEVFVFSVRDDAVAQQVSATMGERVVLRYDQHLGVPSCVAETSYFVTSARSKEGEPAK